MSAAVAGAAPPPLSTQLQFEAPLVRPPYEQLERSARNAQKLVTKELTSAATSAKGLLTKVKAAKQAGSAKELALKSLNAMVASLQGLKRKLEDNAKATDKSLTKLNARLDHVIEIDDANEAMNNFNREMQSFKRSKRTPATAATPAIPATATPPPAAATGFAGAAATAGPTSSTNGASTGNGGDEKGSSLANASPASMLAAGVAVEDQLTTATKRRLDRIFVDHLLREGLYATGAALAADAKLNDLVDLDLFSQAKRVTESLSTFDVSKGLAWCGENRSKLARLRSPLEFNLRVQEFVELIRAQKVSDATQYAQKQFPAFAEDHMTEIQKVMALIAFVPALGPLPQLPIVVPAPTTPGAGAAAQRMPSSAKDDKTGSAGGGGMEVDAGAGSKAAAAAAAGAGAAPAALTRSASDAGPPTLVTRSSSTAGDDAPGPTGLLRRSSSLTSEKGDDKDGDSAADGATAVGGGGGGGGGPDPSAKPDPFKAYRTYFERSRWTDLITQFRAAHFQLHGLTTHSLFDIAMQTCGSSDHLNTNCPVCCANPPINKLTTKLAMAQRLQSRIVCRISGVVMDEHNPPLVLPNGYVYSKSALTSMAARSGGYVTCPRTKQQFPIEQCRMAYIL